MDKIGIKVPTELGDHVDSFANHDTNTEGELYSGADGRLIAGFANMDVGLVTWFNVSRDEWISERDDDGRCDDGMCGDCEGADCARANGAVIVDANTGAETYVRLNPRI